MMPSWPMPNPKGQNDRLTKAAGLPSPGLQESSEPIAMPLVHTHVAVRVSPGGAVSRRGFLRVAGASAGLSLTDRIAAHAEELKKQNRACILLWMAGGP